MARIFRHKGFLPSTTFCSVCAVLLFFLLPVLSRAEAAGSPLQRIRLPPGFSIERIAEVPSARGLAWSPSGTLFVGTRSGQVYALTGYGRGRLQSFRLADGLQQPVGVAFRNGDLYVSAVNRILRLKNIEKQLASPPAPEEVSAAFPADLHHGWKFIAFGPDGQLYVPVGAPCNVCAVDERHAVITKLDVSKPGASPVVVARGVRNTVGFDWHPKTGELWFTDNGRDNLGDDMPPDELNRLSKPGQHFGFPFCHAGTIVDPEFGKSGKCADSVAPAKALGAHVAALGLRFYTGKQFPASYRQSLFIAEHGSWNRSSKNGYRVMQVLLDESGRVTAYQPFATGWLDEKSQEVWGRPADVSVAPDGALLVSDDYAGAVYRISYAPAK